MAADLDPYYNREEDYIDMEVSSNSNFFGHSIVASPPHRREFEFQMFSSSSERETTTSPADELFYKGKLLPLHLPPRLQMVEKLLQDPNSYDHNNRDGFGDCFSTPLDTTAYNTPIENTPFESCNISPSESCQVSREFNPNEYFFEDSTEVSSFIVSTENPKKSWTRKFKRMKQSTLGSKLKASRAYLKSLFGKSGCSDESSASAARKMDEGSLVSKSKECLNKYAKLGRKTPFGQIQSNRYQMPPTASVTKSFNEERINAGGGGSAARHRRSFSGVIKQLSTTKSLSSSSGSSSSSTSSSSSSCSGNSNGLFQEAQLVKRCSSMSPDIENSIQSAIAHCKRSFHSRKTLSEVGFYSLTASREACEDL